jgi:tetratricopeptide (TPR) repeat protein
LNSSEDKSSETVQHKERLGRLLQFIKFDENNATLLSEAFSLALSLDDVDVCRELQQHIENSDVKDPVLFAHLGMFTMHLGDSAKALEYLDYAVTGGVSDGAVIYNLAYCYFIERQFAKAIEVAGALEGESEGLEGRDYLLLARAHHYLEEFSKAIDLLEQCHQKNFGSAETWGVLALLKYEDGASPDEVLVISERSLSFESSNIEARLARGGAFFDLGQLDKSQLEYEKAISDHPESGRAWAGKGQMEFYDFNIQQAVSSLAKAVELMTDHIGTWHLLGWANILQGAFAAAEDAFKRSLELDRAFAESHGGLAAVYAHQAKMHKAKRHIQIAEKISPAGFAVVYAKMLLLNSEGQERDAKNLFEQAQNVYSEQLGTTPKALIAKRLKQLKISDNSKNTKQALH